MMLRGSFCLSLQVKAVLDKAKGKMAHFEQSLDIQRNELFWSGPMVTLDRIRQKRGFKKSHA